MVLQVFLSLNYFFKRLWKEKTLFKKFQLVISSQI